MEKISLNKNWKVYRTGQPNVSKQVDLPFDAMFLDDKKEDATSGVNLGWIDARDYSYVKKLDFSGVSKGQQIILEFEGIYHKASIYFNNVKVAYEEYGYMGIFADVTSLVKPGEDNILLVEAVNDDQPNSRWYSGTGIYRPVWMYTLPEKHIKLEGIRVTTLDYTVGKIKVVVETENCPVGENISIRIEKDDNVVAESVVAVDAAGRANQVFEIRNAVLWSPDWPELYKAVVTVEQDQQSIRFGIRKVEWDSKTGFAINGKRVIIKGACFHHDNGIIGAAEPEFADRRKVEIFKKAGYNALRSAHNPVSKAILDACDELGVLMMDEYVDVWYIHKTKNDYAGGVMENYKSDLARLVAKDYNHPSVVIYSTGNEVAETSQKRGIDFTSELTRTLHELDNTRPVTCGINIFFNWLYSMGFGVYSDKKAREEAKDVKKKKSVGSEFFNNLAGILGAGFMKFGASLYPCDVKTRGAFANMDVAGYNYGINRYVKDLKKYPDRLILGSETFCSDAYRFYELAKKNPRLIGDFVWAGMDYLGEVGVGSWEYEDYAKRMDNGMGWVSAGSGRIDLVGNELGEMAYTRVAFEQDKIGMAVVPVGKANKKHSPSAWKFSNAIPSWDWQGLEGQSTTVEVYARAACVELFLNERALGRRFFKDNCIFRFKNVVYEPGELKAIAYNKTGAVIADTLLKTGDKEVKLSLIPEQEKISLNGGLAYVHLDYTDGNGITKSNARGDIKLKIENGTLLGIGSACPFYEKSYLDDTCDTYYGRAMAVIRPDKAGRMIVKGHSKYGDSLLVIKVID